MSEPVVRVSIIKVPPQDFAMFCGLMNELEARLAPGIQALGGFRYFYAGADEATASLLNVSAWDTLADAHQLDHFEPMLAAGRRFVELGAVFQRPIMNYSPLWSAGAPPA